MARTNRGLAFFSAYPLASCVVRKTMVVLVAGCLVATAGLSPAVAAPPDDGGASPQQIGVAPSVAAPPDGGGYRPPRQIGNAQAIKDQVLVSFTASSRTVQPGGTILFRWEVDGPANDVQVQFDGLAVSRTSVEYVRPELRDERHVLRVVSGEFERILGTFVVGIDPCRAVGPVPVQCVRKGAVAYTYAWSGSSFAYDAARMAAPRSHGMIVLDGCTTDPGQHGRIERYAWALGRWGSAPSRFFTSDECRITADLAEGEWRGTLRATASSGVTLRRNVTVVVKDLLVVSLGDSLASGEGNPDQNGDYFPVHTFSATWKHGACHRSGNSGHVRAAQQIGSDPRYGMTFLSLACSGAGITNVAQAGHNGQPAQLSELHEVLCRFDCTRPIDVLTLSVGINDLGFTEVVKRCVVLVPVESNRSCDTALMGAEYNVDKIRQRLAKVHSGLTGRGITVRRLIITEYPINLFQGGCAIRTGRMEEIGRELNKQIRRAAAEYGWIYAGGVVDEFAGHAYCRSDNGWFRSWDESLDLQGDVEGTAHPNHAGQEAMARRILAAYNRAERNSSGVLADSAR